MKLLFTGASGFLGRNVLPLLEKTYSIKTIGLGEVDNYMVNMAETVPHFVESFDVVLHAAGKAHIVPSTEAERQAFFDVNVQGTKNLCRALEESGIPQAFIFVSTVAVYGCELGNDVSEEHPLGGITPYAKSKIQAEEFLTHWCTEHGVKLGIIRPSLIAGPDPPGNLGAMIRGLKTGRYLSIAGGKARKSVLMVEDIARLVPLLVEKGGVYNVCDDEQPSFRDLEMLICSQLGTKLHLNVPYCLAKGMALIGDCLGNKAPINSLKLKKMTGSLTFSNEKAKRILGWKPMSVLENFRIDR